MMSAFTKRNARDDRAVSPIPNASYRSHCVTGCGPAQLYEMLKYEFIAAHPEVLQDEYERACQRLAKKAGL